MLKIISIFTKSRFLLFGDMTCLNFKTRLECRLYIKYFLRNVFAFRVNTKSAEKKRFKNDKNMLSKCFQVSIYQINITAYKVQKICLVYNENYTLFYNKCVPINSAL